MATLSVPVVKAVPKLPEPSPTLPVPPVISSTSVTAAPEPAPSATIILIPPLGITTFAPVPCDIETAYPAEF